LDSNISPAASIDRSKIRISNPNHVLHNDATGAMSSSATLPLVMGGTGANSASAARSNLGLGTAAVADIGNAPGNVMGASSVPSCFSNQKLQMSLGPLYTWSCVPDNDSLDGTKLPLDGSSPMAGTLLM